MGDPSGGVLCMEPSEDDGLQTITEIVSSNRTVTAMSVMHVMGSAITITEMAVALYYNSSEGSSRKFGCI